MMYVFPQYWGDQEVAGTVAQRGVACCAGLQFVDDGLVVCGMDGALRFFPFAGM